MLLYLRGTNKSGQKVHPVGSKYPNAFGPYDMRVMEWVWMDIFGHLGNETNPKGVRSSKKVIRGDTSAVQKPRYGCSTEDTLPRATVLKRLGSGSYGVTTSRSTNISVSQEPQAILFSMRIHCCDCLRRSVDRYRERDPLFRQCKSPF